MLGVIREYLRNKPEKTAAAWAGGTFFNCIHYVASGRTGSIVVNFAF